MKIAEYLELSKTAESIYDGFSSTGTGPAKNPIDAIPVDKPREQQLPPIGGSTYLNINTPEQKNMSMGKPPYIPVPGNKMNQASWDSIKNTANKAHLMQWYLSNGGQESIAEPHVINTPEFIDQYDGNNSVFFSRNSLLPTMGHEWGHNWHNKTDPAGYRGGSFLGLTLAPLAKRHRLNQEYQASYVQLPEHMRSLWKSNPELYRQFLGYANYANTPAYQTYSMKNPAEAMAFFAPWQERFKSQSMQDVDDRMYGSLLNEAIKHGYDPSTSWGRDPFFQNVPQDTMDPEELIRNDNTILNMPNNAF